jgi:hypothetical protein
MRTACSANNSAEDHCGSATTAAAPWRPRRRARAEAPGRSGHHRRWPAPAAKAAVSALLRGLHRRSAPGRFGERPTARPVTSSDARDPVLPTDRGRNTRGCDLKDRREFPSVHASEAHAHLQNHLSRVIVESCAYHSPLEAQSDLHAAGTIDRGGRKEQRADSPAGGVQPRRTQDIGELRVVRHVAGLQANLDEVLRSPRGAARRQTEASRWFLPGVRSRPRPPLPNVPRAGVKTAPFRRRRRACYVDARGFAGSAASVRTTDEAEPGRERRSGRLASIRSKRQPQCDLNAPRWTRRGGQIKCGVHLLGGRIES